MSLPSHCAVAGTEGVFAFINSMIGDSSQAAAVQRERAGEAPQGKSAHLFAQPAPKPATAGGKKVGRAVASAAHLCGSPLDCCLRSA